MQENQALAPPLTNAAVGGVWRSIMISQVASEKMVQKKIKSVVLVGNGGRDFLTVDQKTQKEYTMNEWVSTSVLTDTSHTQHCISTHWYFGTKL